MFSVAARSGRQRDRQNFKDIAVWADAFLATDALRLAFSRGRRDRGQEGHERADGQDTAQSDGSMQSAIGHGSGSKAALPDQRCAGRRGYGSGLFAPGPPVSATAPILGRSWLMADQNERAARLLVRASYYATEGESRWWVLPTGLNKMTKEAVALAVDRGWMLYRGDAVRLTEAGQDLARGRSV